MSLWPVKTQGGEVNCVAISGNGTYFCSGTVPAMLGTYAYDASGNVLWKHVAAPVTGDNGVYWVAVSRDGKWAASGGGHHKVPPAATRGTGYLFAHEVATGTTTTLLNANIGGVNMVALSGDGSHLVAGGDAAYVFARAGTTFGPPVVLNVAASEAVVAVAISDDGTWVVYGTSSGNVGLYATKPVVPALAGPVNWTAPKGHYIKSVAMAADGSGFAVLTTNRANATGGTPIECNAYFFSLNSSDPPNYFPATRAPKFPAWPLTGCNGTLSIAINAYGTRVATAGNVGSGSSTSGYVFLFDAVSNVQLWVKPTLHGPNSVSMDAAGQQIAVADGFLSAGAFYLFDAVGAAVPINGLLPNQPGAVVSWTIQVASDGSAIAAGGDDATVYYYAAAAKAPPPAAPTNLRIV